MTFCIALGFGILAIVLVITSPSLLNDYPQLAISDKDSVKFILTFTIGGIFTLTIFSYTMVMDVLNRSISNYSPRLIPLILKEKHHQIILGVTSGTIIYCMIMAAFVSGKSSDQFPSVAAPLAILMGIFNILLFIYFIHSVSQSIHVNYVLRKSFSNTKNAIYHIKNLPFEKTCEEKSEDFWEQYVSMTQCGYLNKIRIEKLIGISEEHNIQIKLLKKMGSFILENQPVIAVSRQINDSIEQKIKRCISIDRGEPIDVIEVGFKHMVEVGVKASSPAINDPGTSLMSIDYLTQLFLLRKELPEFNTLKSDKGGVLKMDMVSYQKLAETCFLEMETYMKDDPVLKMKISESKGIIGL
tara:strand:- start:1140 stop:2207 length:1068 start_codon:yes stop_codon:yes gene_type:complete